MFCITEILKKPQNFMPQLPAQWALNYENLNNRRKISELSHSAIYNTSHTYVMSFFFLMGLRSSMLFNP